MKLESISFGYSSQCSWEAKKFGFLGFLVCYNCGQFVMYAELRANLEYV